MASQTGFIRDRNRFQPEYMLHLSGYDWQISLEMEKPTSLESTKKMLLLISMLIMEVLTLPSPVTGSGLVILTVTG